MPGFAAVYLRELLILKRRLKKLAAAALVSPLLYLLTFGCALGGRLTVDGRSYIEFLLPGLVAMGGMTQAFSMASEINVTRFYSSVFEVIQAAPVGRTAYVLGEVCAGLTRAVLGCALTLLLGAFFGVGLHCGFFFWLAVLLNGIVFSALAVAMAMIVKSHADQGLLNAFVITPMAFLGGTFFPIDKMPDWLRGVLSLLPLTHASRAIRAGAFGQEPAIAAFAVLAISGTAFLLLAIHLTGKARD